MDYLLGLLSILMVNLLLSGDNALVIALASRNLPDKHKKAAIVLGGAGAVILRILLTFIAFVLLKIPYLQLLGGLLLFWIAVQLTTDKQEQPAKIAGEFGLGAAIKTIIVADLVMSLDNVIAIVGVAKGNVSLIIVGLVISIPIIIWGSQLISLLMERWPIIIKLGAAFLGWTAGEMALADQKVVLLIEPSSWLHWLIPITFAALTLLVGSLVNTKRFL